MSIEYRAIGLAMPPRTGGETFEEVYDVILLLDDRENFGLVRYTPWFFLFFNLCCVSVAYAYVRFNSFSLLVKKAYALN